jgi:hypothetical protein
MHVTCVIFMDSLDGNGQGAIICTSTLFPLCGKYLLVTEQTNKQTDKQTNIPSGFMDK